MTPKYVQIHLNKIYYLSRKVRYAVLFCQSCTLSSHCCTHWTLSCFVPLFLAFPFLITGHQPDLTHP